MGHEQRLHLAARPRRAHQPLVSAAEPRRATRRHGERHTAGERHADSHLGQLVEHRAIHTPRRHRHCRHGEHTQQPPSGYRRARLPLRNVVRRPRLCGEDRPPHEARRRHLPRGLRAGGHRLLRRTPLRSQHGRLQHADARPRLRADRLGSRRADHARAAAHRHGLQESVRSSGAVARVAVHQCCGRHVQHAAAHRSAEHGVGGVPRLRLPVYLLLRSARQVLLSRLCLLSSHGQVRLLYAHHRSALARSL